MASNQQSFYL